MRHPSAGIDGRRHLIAAAAAPRWLLIGNSRWHWAERTEAGHLRGWDGSPPASGDQGPAPLAWAAVGPLPDPRWMPAERRVSVGEVPLAGCPGWLGVDRALAGWGAWRELGETVLVADAGTVLSLTLVDARGRFRGGRLLAGLGLQLEAMAHGTALLPRLPVVSRPASDGAGSDAGDPGGEDDPAWPFGTAAAMRAGVERGLAAAVAEAALASTSKQLVLTGGDGALLRRRLTPALAGHGITVSLRPLLCLESLSSLRPEP